MKNGGADADRYAYGSQWWTEQVAALRLQGLLDPVAFDEDSYLAAHPDVRDAVARGVLASGAFHYITYGAKERRALLPDVRPHPPRSPLREGIQYTRRDKALLDLRLADLRGAEIGALALPMVRRDEGNIIYIDHADTAALRQKYATHDDIDCSKIVEVDAVWGEQTLRDCVGARAPLDYVVASHVIEHVPDMVTWLADIASILKPGGELRLVIPDRRYTFDILRLETRLHDVLDAYVRRAAIPSPRAILEHYLLLRRVPEPADWPAAGLDLPALQPYAGVEFALNLARDALANGTYHDVHCWIFTPRSFLGLCHELAKAGLLSFQLGYWIDTAVKDKEFFAGLRRCDNHAEAVASWARALNGRPA
jgi:2-polyprenyl-3-methyl-5-hydroxy-6-metoxy-1,4-benzoquinol methylase